MISRISFSCAAAVLAFALTASRATAQEAESALTEPYLSSAHWSQHALRRMAGLGLIGASDALDAWPLRRSEVRALFAAAVQAAERGNDRGARTIAGNALAAFNSEFPRPAHLAVAAARLRTGWLGHDGAMLGGTTVQNGSGGWVYPGPTPARARDGVLADATVEGSWRAVTAAVHVRGFDAARVDEAYAALALGPLDVWAGRRSLAFGAGRTGAIVLSPEVPLDGAGVRTSRAISLPGFLDGIVLRGAFMISRLENSGRVRHPWFSAARVSLSPSSNLVFGFHRAAIFGGEGNVQPLTGRNVLFMLFGLTGQLGKDSGFENQVASIDAWLRMAPGGLPLVAYGELGIDDVGFSMLETAGFLAGITLPSVPGVPALSLGLEHARFPGSCCGHPPWYRHSDLGDGWTTNGNLLAHPLGGHGHEWAFLWELSTARAQLAGRAFTRERRSENLFSPDRAGSSFGAAFDATIPLRRAVLFRSVLGAERGTGWSAWTVDLGVQLLIGAEGGAPTVNRNARAGAREKMKGIER